MTAGKVTDMQGRGEEGGLDKSRGRQKLSQGGQDWPVPSAGEYLDRCRAQRSLREGSHFLKRLEAADL